MTDRASSTVDHGGFAASVADINEIRIRDPQRISDCWPRVASGS